MDDRVDMIRDCWDTVKWGMEQCLVQAGPRVISLEELDCMDDEPVWLETDGRCFCVIVRSGGRLCAPENDEIPEELLESGYNATWRLWNGKPAPERRMREKWGEAET